jgi:hypothetical protein
MRLSKDEFEASLEILDRVNMLGYIDGMDNEFKLEVVESFFRCNNLFLHELNKRPVIEYKDEKRHYFMYVDSFKTLTEDEIAQLTI